MYSFRLNDLISMYVEIIDNDLVISTYNYNNEFIPKFRLSMDIVEILTSFKIDDMYDELSISIINKSSIVDGIKSDIHIYYDHMYKLFRIKITNNANDKYIIIEDYKGLEFLNLLNLIYGG